MNSVLQIRGLLARVLLLAGFVFGVLGLVPSAQAQTNVFKRNNATDISTTPSWSTTSGGGTSPTTLDASEIGVFDSTVAAGNASLTMSANLTLGGLKILNPAAAITLNGSGAIRTLNLGNFSFANGGGIDLSNATVGLTLGSNIALVLQGRSQTWTIGNATTHPGLTVNGTVALNQSVTLAGTGPATFSGVISGTGVMYLNSSNTTTLSAVNTFSGGVTLSSGTLILSNNGTGSGSSLGTGMLTILGGTINTGATVVALGTNNNVQIDNNFTFTGSNSLNFGTGYVSLGHDVTMTVSANTVTMSNVIDGWDGSTNLNSNGFSLTKAGAGTLSLGGTGYFSGNLNLTAGTLALTSNLALQNATLNFTAGTLTLTGLTNSTFGGLAGTQNIALPGTGFALTLNPSLYDNDVYSGNLSGTSATVTINGTGLEAFSGNNTYTGGTTLSSGTFAINNGGNATSSAIGTGTLTIQGGNLDNTSGSNQTLATNNAEAWNGNFTFLGSGNLNMGTGAVTMNASRTVTVNADTFTVGGNISGSGFSLTKNGAGELGLGGNNTYTGGTILNAGTLDINFGGTAAGSSLGTGAFTINGGSIDNTNGSTVTLGTNNTQNWNGNFTFVGSNSLNLGTGAVAMNASRTVTVNANTLTVGGVISGSGDGLTLNGSGTLALTGNNTYSGPTTINNGATLDVNILNNGGTNSGIGSSSAVAANLVIDGGTLQYTGTTAASTNRLMTVGANGATFDASGTNTLTFTNTSAVVFSNTSAPTTITFTGTNTSTNTFDPVIGDAGSGSNTTSVVKNGSGEWVLNATNTYTGGTTLNSGTLALKNAAALGNGTLTINGGSLNNTNATMTLANNINQVWNGNWTYVGSNATNMGTGQVLLGNNITLTTTASTLTIGGTISDNGEGFSLTKAGAGTLVLNATNLFSGNMNLQAGTLTLGSLTALQNATLDYTGGTLGLATGTNNFGGLAGSTNIGLGTNNITVTTVANANNTYSGVISGTGNLTFNGAGTETLSGASSMTGNTTVNGGTVILSGNRTGNLTTTTLNGGTIIVNTNGTTTSGAFGRNGTLTITGGNLDTTNANTTIAGNVAENWNGNFTFIGSGNLSTGTGAVTLGANATVTVNNNTLTVAGNISDGASTFSLQKAGAGTLVLTGNVNAYNGSTIVSGGTLRLDYSGLANNTANIVSNSSPLLLTGGQLNIVGRSGTSNQDLQAFNGTSIGPGNSSLVGTMATGSAQGLLIKLGTVTRVAGGTVDVIKPVAGNVNGTMTTTNNVVTSNGIAYMTVNGTDWANLTAGNVSAIAAASYSNNTANSTWANTTNLRVSANVTMNASRTLGTLLYNGTSNVTLNAGGATLTMNTGGLLMSSNATGNFTISNGSITGLAGAASELVIFQNMGGNFTISANVVNNGANATSLTKSGTGELILSGTNTYSGNTFLNLGTLAFGSTKAIGTGNLVISGGVLDATSSLTNANNNNQIWAGDFSFAGSNDLNMGTGTITMSASRTLTVSAGNLTEGGNISGTGFSITKNGTGNLILTGAGSNFTGGVNINGGILEAAGDNSLGAAGSNVTVASGASLKLDNGFNTGSPGNATGSSNGALLTLNGTGVGGMGALVDGNGSAQWQGNIAMVGDTTIGAGSTSGGFLTLGSDDVTSNLSMGAYNLTLTGGANTNMTLQTTITGAGNLTVNTDSSSIVTFYMYTNTYTGTTFVNNGTLLLDTFTNAVGVLPGQGNLAINGPLVIGDGVGAAGTAILQMGSTNGDEARNIIAENSNVTINSDGYFHVNGEDQIINNLTMNAGLIDTTNYVANSFGTLTIAGNATIQANPTTAVINGNFEMANSVGNATTVFTVNAGGNTTSDFTINALLSGGSMVKNGAGTMVLTNNANSYTGTTEVQTGTLNIQAGGALGATGVNAVGEGTTVDAGAQLQMQGNIAVGNEYLNLNGNGTGGSDGALRNVAGDNSWAGTVNVASNSTVDTAANSLLFSGSIGSNATAATLTFNGNGNTTISGTISGPVSVVKNGTGTLLYNGTTSNTNTGTTTVNAGTLELNAPSGTVAVSGSTITINSGGTLLSDTTENIGNGVNMVLNGGTWTTNGAAAATFTENLNTLTLTANSTLNLGSGQNTIAYTNSSGTTWGGDSILYIDNWNGLLAGSGTDQVYFGTSAGGLSGTSYSGQLGDIIFVNPTINGVAQSTNYHAIILSTGEVVPFLPAPEPGTVAAGAALGALALVREVRRRKNRVAANTSK